MADLIFCWICVGCVILHDIWIGNVEIFIAGAILSPWLLVSKFFWCRGNVNVNFNYMKYHHIKFVSSSHCIDLKKKWLKGDRSGYTKMNFSGNIYFLFCTDGADGRDIQWEYNIWSTEVTRGNNKEPKLNTFETEIGWQQWARPCEGHLIQDMNSNFRLFCHLTQEGKIIRNQKGCYRHNGFMGISCISYTEFPKILPKAIRFGSLGFVW